MQYVIKALNSKNYALEQNQVFLGKLAYDNSFFCSKATIQIKGKSFRIENTSHWNSECVIKEEEQRLFKTKLNWNSELIMNTLNQGNPKEYKLKAKSAWGNTHTLLDQNHKELFVIQSEYKWKKFNYEHAVTASEAFESIPDKELILFSVLQGIKTKTAYMALFIIFIGVILTSN
jgi:hypothetical protein